MGISPFKKSSYSSYDIKPNISLVNETLPNQNPNNDKIIRYEKINNYLLIEIKYLDCINYEGKKIMVYKDCSIDDLLNQIVIDPHFSENKKMISPIVRFEPTNNGWKMGIKFIKLM